MTTTSRQTILALAIAVCIAAVGCGEDAAPGAGPPSIVSITPECVPSPDSEFDGQVLDQIEVVVTDAEGDAAYVTIAVGGSVLRVDEAAEDGGESVFTYVAPADDNSFLRCDSGTVVVVRAVDEAGHVAEMEVTLL